MKNLLLFFWCNIVFICWASISFSQIQDIRFDELYGKVENLLVNEYQGFINYSHIHRNKKQSHLMAHYKRRTKDLFVSKTTSVYDDFGFTVSGIMEINDYCQQLIKKPFDTKIELISSSIIRLHPPFGTINARAIIRKKIPAMTISKTAVSGAIWKKFEVGFVFEIDSSYSEIKSIRIAGIHEFIDDDNDGVGDRYDYCLQSVLSEDILESKFNDIFGCVDRDEDSKYPNVRERFKENMYDENDNNPCIPDPCDSDKDGIDDFQLASEGKRIIIDSCLYTRADMGEVLRSNGCVDEDRDGYYPDIDSTDSRYDSDDNNICIPRFGPDCYVQPLVKSSMKNRTEISIYMNSDQPITNLYAKNNLLLSTTWGGELALYKVEINGEKVLLRLKGAHEELRGTIGPQSYIQNGSSSVEFDVIRKKTQESYTYELDNSEYGGRYLEKPIMNRPRQDTTILVMDMDKMVEKKVPLRRKSVCYQSDSFILAVQKGDLRIWQKHPYADFWVEAELESRKEANYSSVTLDEANQLLFAGTEDGLVDIYSIDYVEKL